MYILLFSYSKYHSVLPKDTNHIKIPDSRHGHRGGINKWTYLFIKSSTRPMAYQPDGDRGQNLNP
ncbi:hypothetical protein ACIXMP_18545, partial [Bacteroides fragilis]